MLENFQYIRTIYKGIIKIQSIITIYKSHLDHEKKQKISMLNRLKKIVVKPIFKIILPESFFV